MSHREQIGLGADPALVAWLVQRLRWSDHPITRDTLSDELVVYAELTYGLHWRRATAARRLREAINRAIEDGWPIVSVRGGFQLARTREQRQIAAARLREQARTLFARAERLEDAPVPGDAVQGSLFAEAV